MKQLFSVFLLMLSFHITSWAQLSGDRTVPSTDYPDLQTVADSLDLYDIGAGGVNFLISGGSTFEEGTLYFTASATVDDPVYIGWDGTGTKPIVNFEGSALESEAGITLSGTDHYTIDGLEITNVSSNLEIGILIRNADAQNGAQNNTVSNVDITLDKLNPFQTSGISVIALVEPTVFDGNNHENKFYNNSLHNMTIGYFLDGGTSTTSLMCVGNEVGIEDEGASLIEDIVLAGITARDQNGFNFSHTTIRDLTRIGDGTIAPAAIATSSGNPSTTLSNEIIISNNTIEDLTSSFTSIFGMYLSARKVTYDVSNNTIHNVTATGGGGNTADGMMLFATDAKANIYNNMISGLAAPASALSNNAASRGINLRTFQQANVYFNTVALEFEATEPAHTAAAFTIFNNSDLVQMSNNIFINKTTLPEDATGLVTAVYKRNNTFDGILAGSDNNIYYAGEPGPQHLIYYGHSTSTPNVHETLAEYQVATATFDQNSYTEDVSFVASDDLHILTSSTTLASDNAADITDPVAITTDFDGDIREPGSSDIGADEINTLLPDVAIDPNPEDGALGVSVELTEVSWTYQDSPEFATPAAFNVYFGETDELDEPSLISTVSWEDGVENYSATIAALASETVYYWKVVPTTAIDDGDTPEIVAVWSFTSDVSLIAYPNAVENPSPAMNEAIDSNVDNIVTLGWDYTPDPAHEVAAQFEIYGSSDMSDPNWGVPIAEVDYVEGQVAYEIELTDDPNFSYDFGVDNFWKVVPVAASGESTPDAAVWVFSFDEPSGLNDEALSGTLIYPNPAIDQLTIAPGFNGTYDVEVHDMQGRMVNRSIASQGVNTIDVHTIEAGTYQVLIRQNGSIFTGLIQVESR